ncbi:MAG: hypothetical protein IVW55_14145 [Chloroflexi bacterium]|nr:hypothetical protein [Chloroflexota bacterium]
MRKHAFAISLFAIGALDLWLAYEAIGPASASGDWVMFLPAIIFLAVAVAALIAGVNLYRPKHRRR